MASVAAVIIFILMFVLIVLDKIKRHYVTLGCGLLTLVIVFGLCMQSVPAIIETLNIHSFFSASFWYTAGESGGTSAGINWETIVFLASMMVMVEGMGRAGFFRWLCLTIAKAVKYRTIPIFITFMVISALLAMFIDSITVILFLAAVTIELAQLLKFSPVPMILAEIFCANLGGSATMCGDPPNIIIGTSLGYTFADFVTNTGFMALIALVFVVIYFYICFRKELRQSNGNTGEVAYPEPGEAIENKRDFIISCVIFALAVALLVTHAQTGLTVAAIGVFITIITLLSAGKDAIILLKKVDYETILFFVGLFVVVGGLEQTGILAVVANFIGDISAGNALLMIAIVLWISALASAFVDNIPFAATMIPIIKTLSATQGVDLSVLAWTLSMGTDIGGSATPIGASANVVGISMAAKEGHLIGWGKYCRYAVPATIMVEIISMICIYVRYF